LFPASFPQPNPVTSDLAPRLKLADHCQGGGGTLLRRCTRHKSFERKILPLSY